MRDIETVAAFGLKACVAITAVTAQTQAAFEANSIESVKIGMLANRAIALRVAAVLASHPDIPVVLDPVLMSSSGRALLDDAGVKVLCERLLPLSSAVTPNLPELFALTGIPAVEPAANLLLEKGAHAVLVKGGHGDGPMSTDILLVPGKPPIAFSSKRLPFTMRGTGCMLASAIAAGLAQKLDLEEAVEAAKKHLSAIFADAPYFRSEGD